MELKTLLENSGWEKSEESFSPKMISRNTEKTISKNMRVLFVNNYKALALNVFFLSITLYVYLRNPTIDFLIPSILVASCFLFLTISVWGGIVRNSQIDRSQPIAIVLSEVLERNKMMYQQQCKYHSILITQSFLGGFFLGLAFQGWTLKEAAEKPVIFAIVVPLTVGCYYLTKTKSFQAFNRSLNPSYFRAKASLESQLAFLSE